MNFSYVLSDPAGYPSRELFESHLDLLRRCGYDAVELQIADPAEFPEEEIIRLAGKYGFRIPAFQTGASYATRGNCLSSPDAAVRRRTIDLMLAFVDLARRLEATIVFGSLQGRRSDEPDKQIGEARIRDALAEIGERATQAGVTLAFEPVNHMEVGFHNTLAEAERLVRKLGLPGVKLMVDTFHMNIEEADMTEPLARVADLLSHVHLSDSNRDVLGSGHFPTDRFLARLTELEFAGYVSVGVYNSALSVEERIVRCAAALGLKP